MGDENALVKQIKINTSLYEEYSEVIHREIYKRRHKWHLTAISYMDFDDVVQIIKLHVLKKIHQYDKNEGVFVNWLNTLISNQIRNLLRNHYGAFNKICNSCEASEVDNKCAIYKEQCSKCPAYYNWSLSRKGAYNVKLALSSENHFNEINSLPSESIDIDRSSILVHKKMLSVLNPIEGKVYRLLYIEHKTEQQVALALITKTFSKKVPVVTQKDLKSIENYKDKIISKAKKLIYSNEIDLSGVFN